MVTIRVATCWTQGKWVYDQVRGKLYTAWNDQPLNARFGAIKQPGRYLLQVSARNHGTVPAGYEAFEVDVWVIPKREDVVDLGALGPPAARLVIPASETAYHTVSTVLEIPATDVLQVTLVWRNDLYRPPTDANIEYGNILLMPAG